MIALHSTTFAFRWLPAVWLTLGLLVMLSGCGDDELSSGGGDTAAASPSTSAVDRTRKLEEYKRHPTLRCILLVETVLPQVLLYRRNDEGWAIEAFDGLDAIIDLPEIAAQLTLADIYDGLTFGPRWDPADTPPGD